MKRECYNTVMWYVSTSPSSGDGPVVSSEEEAVETAPEKRLRLAKEYLAQIQDEGVCLRIINFLV